jgi:5-methylcytosine-specific restriction protein A
MPRALCVCPTSGCHNLTPGGRCPDCRTEAEQRRGSAAQRGYSGRHWTTARRACLLRDPLCVCTDAGHGHDGRQCIAPSTVADHHPTSRRDLIVLGVTDPDAPHRLRGICSRCHNKHTAHEQPGGWAARHSR